MDRAILLAEEKSDVIGAIILPKGGGYGVAFLEKVVGSGPRPWLVPASFPNFFTVASVNSDV
jgi:hypothetical protein